LFEKAGIKDPPKTWQELLDVNSKLVQRTGNNLIQAGIALGTSSVANASSIMPLLMMQNGASITNNPPTVATLDKPDNTNYPSSAKALDFYTSFAKPTKSNYSWSDGFGESTTAFSQGRVGMIIDFPYKFLIINSRNPNLKYKMSKIPQVNLNNPINYSEYWAEGVSTTTKYPDIAWDFYNFMTSYEIMNKYSAPTMKPASRLDLAEAQKQDSLIGVFAEQVPSAKNYYKGNSAAADLAILEMINTALSGFDPAIAVRSANEKVGGAIKQYPY
jgi:multiple sugar transport system substrate-binding protein